MNTDWEKAIEFVLKAEGGENGETIPHDNGGFTKFGISSVANPDIDVEHLTRDGAKDVYKSRYWQACHCDELPSPLAMAVFDAAVNQGVRPAIKMLQIALGVTVDGVVGDMTIAAAFKANINNLTRRYLSQRMARYARTIMKDTTQEVFIENWSHRLMSVAELVFSQQKLATA